MPSGSYLVDNSKMQIEILILCKLTIECHCQCPNLLKFMVMNGINSYSKMWVKFQEIFSRCSWAIVSTRIRQAFFLNNLKSQTQSKISLKISSGFFSKAVKSTKILLYHKWHTVLNNCFHRLSLASWWVNWSLCVCQIILRHWFGVWPENFTGKY